VSCSILRTARFRCWRAGRPWPSAVVALRAGQPEQPLLEEGVAPVPQREPEAEPLLDVAEPGQRVRPDSASWSTTTVLADERQNPNSKCIIWNE
jgi:hypothetical protein